MTLPTLPVLARKLIGPANDPPVDRIIRFLLYYGYSKQTEPIMQAAQFIRKYSVSNAKSGPVRKNSIDSTVKWVEYAADLVKMTDLVRVAKFEEKWALTEAMQVAERKKNWHYRQENFNLGRASVLLSAFMRGK